MVLTTPLSAWYFGAVSLIGIVTNLLTLWLINYIFLSLGILCGVSLLSFPLARFGARVLSWLIRFVIGCAEVLASLPLSAVYTASAYIVAWLVFSYILLGIFLFSRRRKPVALICCCVIGLCLALMASWLEPMLDNVRLTVLDVGQGQSIILQCDAGVYLIDCGGDDDADAADKAAETLLSQGITRLDGIILTHADRDHAGAVANLLTRIPSDRLFLSVTTDPEAAENLLQDFDGEVIWVDEEVTVSSGEEIISIIGPTFASESNENSLCVLFEGENCAILVTGDRGFLGEALLMRQKELPNVDVLIAGHHGSKYSTSEALLDAVRPEVVIISAGADNPYGHPAPELLERLEIYGCRIYRTDQNGTIIYRR
jgi:competence protein ComEC